MTIHSYKTLLHETGVPYLATDHSYEVDGRQSYSTPEDITSFILQSLKIQNCAEEYLYVICFNTRNRLIGCFEASHGNINTSLVSVREIMQKALMIGAVKIALTHNHPGGDSTPSDYDIQSTKTLKEACNIMGIELLDHIIVSQTGWYSMKDQNTF